MKKTWTIEVDFKNGKHTMKRVNNGFSAFDLLGVLEFAKQEIMEQMKETIKPDIITRKVIKRIQEKS